MNDELQIQEYQPDYLAIGDDGGGLVFLMKQEPDAKKVICVDMSDYDIETSFSQLLTLTKELPCALIRGIMHAKAIKLMEEAGQTDIFEFRENSY